MVPFMEINFYKMYGLKPMTLKEELDAPIPIKKTRGNKVSIVNNCDEIIKVAEDLREYAKRIPEENDPSHMALVQKLEDAISTVKLLIDEASYIRQS